MARVKLTAAAVERLTSRGKDRIEYFDQTFPSFGVRVTARGSKSWFVYYRIGGRLRRLTLGTFPVDKLAEAREKARNALKMVEHGIDPAKVKEREKAERLDTVRRVVAEFIERHAKARNRSWRQTEAVFEKEVLPDWGDRPIKSITRRDVRDLLDGIMDRGTPYVANRTLAAIRKLFNWCLERDIVDASPVAGVKPPAKEAVRERALSEAEVKEVWTAAETLGYPFGPLTQLLLLLGQRRQETANMRWADLDLEEGTWNIPSDSTKAGRGHVVPLPPLALEIIKRLPRQRGPYAFSTTAGEKPVSGFSRAKKQLDRAILAARQNAAGQPPEDVKPMEGWRFHDLRRTVGTHLAGLGIPLDHISRVLNHVPVGVTAKVYDRHFYLPEKRRALEVWANKLQSLIAPDNDSNVVALHV